MEITISLVAIVIAILLVNEVLTHLLNWWIREWDDIGEGLLIPILTYIFKITFTILILIDLLK